MLDIILWCHETTIYGDKRERNFGIFNWEIKFSSSTNIYTSFCFINFLPINNIFTPVYSHR